MTNGLPSYYHFKYSLFMKEVTMAVKKSVLACDTGSTDLAKRGGTEGFNDAIIAEW